MKTLLLDNYDSFTYNLYQALAMLGGEPHVHRNDRIAMDMVRASSFTHIVIGPGPGNPDTPRDIGISEALIEHAAAKRIPLLGVCLGHQIIGKHFGAIVKRAPTPCHGSASAILVLTPRSRLFADLPGIFEGMRYHSLCVEDLPEILRQTATASDGTLMGLEHRGLPMFGVQFHPESIGTPCGKDILRNFLSIR